MTACLLYGGGYDSTALALYLKKIDLIHFHYGQKGQKAECKQFLQMLNAGFEGARFSLMKQEGFLERARFSCPTLPTYWHNSAGVMKWRNPLLISAAICLGYDRIYYAGHIEPKGSRFYDATPKFLRRMNKAMKVLGAKVISPFSNLTREEVFDIGVQLNPELMWRARKASCWNGNLCGRCSHCRQGAKFWSRYLVE